MEKLNLKYYNANEVYSDGDVELEILDMVRQSDDYSEILKNDNRWAVLYHLTPLRRNLLEWYDFNKDAEVLEIGAGMGAITGLLCEKTKHVTAVELSKTRATIIAERTKKYNNLEIIVGNLNDIEFDKKFDYITLIGVLEYAGRYTDSDNPYYDFLNNIKKLLKPDGKLIIAIENKFGLKYWSGAKEDHTGTLFDSIENYKKNVGIETFGKYELEQLVKSVGFQELEFYYPMPDYKIPTQIFSDERTPNYGQLADCKRTFDQERIEFFDEISAFQNIINNKQFGFFANSFLVFAGNSVSEEKTIYTNFKRETTPELQIATSIIQSGENLCSQKFSLSDEAQNHINDMYNNYKYLKQNLKDYANYDVAEARLDNDRLTFEYAYGENFQDLVQKAITTRNKSLLLKYFDLYKKILSDIYPVEIKDYNSKNSEKYFGNIEIKNAKCIENANIDLIFDNIILNGEKIKFIDYEWLLYDSIPLNYLITKNILNMKYKYADKLLSLMPLEDIYKYFDISEDEIPIYEQMEYKFLEYVYKNANFRIGSQYYKAINTYPYQPNVNTEKRIFKIKIGRFILQLLKKRRNNK